MFLRIIAFTVVSFLAGGFVFAQGSLSNAGIIPANIWFSKDPFFASDEVRIYTVFFNNGETDLTGTVAFHSGNIPIGSTDFAIAAGRVQDVWIDWVATEGNHTISARILSAQASEPGSDPLGVELINNETGTREQFVDTDTDGDEIGNQNDTDDDGDGLPDDEEIRIGTDPLNADTDGDGIEDGEDSNPMIKNAEALEGEGEGIFSDITEKIPSGVTETVEPVFNFTNSFRETQLTKIEDRIRELEEEIEEAKKEAAEDDLSGSDTASSSAEFESSFSKAWRWIVLWSNKFLKFVFSSSFVFHVLAAILIIPILKWTFKLILFPFRRRRR